MLSAHRLLDSKLIKQCPVYLIISSNQ
jgi:hypothetical protein